MNRNGSRALLSRELGRARMASAEVDRHACLGKLVPVLFCLNGGCGDELPRSTVRHGGLWCSGAALITLA